MNHLVWLREDLRTEDNHALHHASQQGHAVIAAYVIDTKMWQKHHIAACQVEFILRALKNLSVDLERLNISLKIIQAKGTQAAANALHQLATQHDCTQLFFNKQYEVNEKKRDAVITDYFQQRHISVNSYDDQVIFSPGTILTNNNTPYTVFTPFKKKWYEAYRNTKISLLPQPNKQKTLVAAPDDVPDSIAGFHSTIDQNNWPASEAQALGSLDEFIEQKITAYKEDRDIPSVNGTSRISVYLATGLLSAHQCIKRALSVNKHQLDSGNPGITTWISEIIWREFYKHILYHFPRVSQHQPFQLKTKRLQWMQNEVHFQAWCKGQTGIPIVDAAMRQLNQTGWMHNRCRMIVAMFLTKNLFLDWRLGEQYFMQHLIDGDLAANNGGWQWSASTGTDAAPYFRIFNPVSQSERFDPDGDYIRQYCPELADIDNKSIHDPHNRLPKPIVDLKTTRKAAIEAFKELG